MPYDLSIPGWASLEKLKTIERWAKEIPENGVVVQVGCFLGRTVNCWARSVDPSVKIYCIDEFVWNGYEVRDGKLEIDDKGRPIRVIPWRITYDPLTMFREYTKNLNNIVILKGRCPDEITYTNPDIDLLFLDANYENEWEIVEAHRPYLKSNAAICGQGYDDPQYHDKAMNTINLIRNRLGGKLIIDRASCWKIQI